VTPTLGAAIATSVQFSSNNAILDSNANKIIVLNPVASAVNYLKVQNNSTGNSVVISADGSDTNIGLLVEGKGTSGAQIKGVTSGANASSGFVGEYFSNTVTQASPTSITTSGTVQNLTNISLTAGDYDVYGNIGFNPASTTNVTSAVGWISSTSATEPALEQTNAINYGASGLVIGATQFGFNVPLQRISLSSTTTIYISMVANFSISTMTMYGGIYARRRR
jgi:hypothetical protein